jgi:hypothetical protein
MPRWRIYYGDGSVRNGRTRLGWRRAPKAGVQVVVVYAPYPDAPHKGWTPWAGARGDRQYYTGTDEYDIGHGVKQGTQIEDAAYRRIWERALAD